MSKPKPTRHNWAVIALAVLVAAGGVLATLGVGGLPISEHSADAADSNNIPDTPIEVASLQVRAPRLTLPTLDYSLDTVARGAQPVPRIFVASVPDALDEIHETDERKALFFRTVLPLVLNVNQDILQDREKLTRLRDRIQSGGAPNAAERLWLTVMAERYGLGNSDDAGGEVDLDRLVRRVDVVPPSLAMAQAAKESGWGRSRFAKNGNALFGQWTWSDDHEGLVPEARQDGKSHRVRAFDTLLASVRAYVRNLNSHRAYKEFRSLRAKLRERGEPIRGKALAGTLHRYSELGHEYTERLKTMIDYNDLDRFDDARLAPGAG